MHSDPYEIDLTKVNHERNNVRELHKRNSDLKQIENSYSFRVDSITNFVHADSGLPIGSRVNYSYGRAFGRNTNHHRRSEDFPNLPQEWEAKKPEPVKKVGFRDGHVCAVEVDLTAGQDTRDEESRARILALQGNLEPYPFQAWGESLGRKFNAIDKFLGRIEDKLGVTSFLNKLEGWL